MTFIKNNWVGLVAIVIAILSLLHFAPSVNFGSVDTNCQGTTTCLSDLYLGTTWGGTGSFRAAGTAIVDGATTLSGLTTLAAGQLNTFAVATTTVTETLALADVNKYDTVILNPNVAAGATLTFFASSTASAWLPTAGNSQRTCFINGTTSAGAIITFAGGTGVKLLAASSTATSIGSLTIYPQKMGCFTFTRANSTATTFDILAAYTAFN